MRVTIGHLLGPLMRSAADLAFVMDILTGKPEVRPNNPVDALKTLRIGLATQSTYGGFKLPDGEVRTF